MPPFDHEKCRFFGNSDPEKLICQYGSPLYVYNEAILRQRCRDVTNLVSYRPFTANFSCKANK